MAKVFCKDHEPKKKHEPTAGIPDGAIKRVVKLRCAECGRSVTKVVAVSPKKGNPRRTPLDKEQ